MKNKVEKNALQNIFGQQIPMTTAGFELRISCIRSSYLTQEIRSSNPPVVAGICDPNKYRARHHSSLKLGSKLKYLNITKYLYNTTAITPH